MKPTVARARGFTLVEMLVAVAAVTLIILGVTRIFAATGDTLRAGRRVSYLNAYAGVIEQQLREDIASMSRDGFLLIRHEVVPNVEVVEGQGARDRRADELLFFAEGRFRSERAPLAAGTVAESSEACIYYGHGLRGAPSASSYAQIVLPYAYPLPSDLLPPLGAALPGGVPGPNEFASDWILLRHETLLASASAVDRAPLPASLGFAAGAERDSEVQYAYEPAAANIFRNMTPLPRSVLGSIHVARKDANGDGRAMRLQTGVIDIATTDLAEIRSIILDARDPLGVNYENAGDYPFDLDAVAEPGAVFSPVSSIGSSINNDAVYMQEWMKLALPANSDPAPNHPVDRDGRMRMRCELAPPNILGVQPGTGAIVADEAWQAEVRADQLMLSASNFVPHCTEFMVEWSFGFPPPGQTSPTGEIQWFGGRASTTDARPVPYGNDRQTVVPRIIGHSDGTWRNHVIQPQLIHGPGTAGLRNVLYSFFGYVDPTYWPHADVWPGPSDHPPTYEPSKGHVTSEPISVPWPWPRLLRITITLADPNEPTKEQSYQYVFELPDYQNQ